MQKKYIIALSILFLLICTVFASSYYQKTNDINMSYPNFLSAVDQNQVDSITFSENSNFFQLKLLTESDSNYIVPNPKTENFIEFLLIKNITVNYENTGVIPTNILLFFLLISSFFTIWYIRSGKNKVMIKNENSKNNKDRSISLNNVAGNAEAKSMLEDIIGFIKEPAKYDAVGARMPKGVLLYGPPGTGKTLLAKAVAGEANVPFYAMSGSDFVQMYVGVGASRIRSLFNKAKKSEKAVIFIDEIDAIGKKRSRNNSSSNDERDQTLNALLTEMSGFHENTGIIVIGATNRLDTLDEALLRPGRFDRQIEIGLPDVNSRTKILTLHGNTKPLSEDIDFESLAKSTVYFSGAMLENLLNEAAIYAANDSKTIIMQKHIDKAFYTVIAGAQKIDQSYLTNKDRKITAYHEAGHTLATKLLLPENYISKVTIIPSVNGSGGFNLSIPTDTLYQSQRQIKAMIQTLLAGRIAEELIFGKDEVTTGASNDIQKASTLIYDYINKYGMDSDFGLFSLSASVYDEDSQLITKCRTLMNSLYEDTKQLFQSNLNLLENISLELLNKESLDGYDIDRICA
jgi:cell division protease FtsH